MSRSFCYQCHRAQEACICGQSSKIFNDVNIIILQHPTETKNPKGSAIIAKLYLKNVTIWTGEDFSRHKPLNTFLENHPESSFLVYPCKTAHRLDKIHSINTSGFTKQSLNLIFIDASWRKAKKIWKLSENLHSLPCLQLEPENRSNYRIRKIPGNEYLSTIESIHHCLVHIENNTNKYNPLLDVFNRMIDFQINKMGNDTFQANYKSTHGN